MKFYLKSIFTLLSFIFLANCSDITEAKEGASYIKVDKTKEQEKKSKKNSDNKGDKEAKAKANKESTSKSEKKGAKANKESTSKADEEPKAKTDKESTSKAKKESTSKAEEESKAKTDKESTSKAKKESNANNAKFNKESKADANKNDNDEFKTDQEPVAKNQNCSFRDRPFEFLRSNYHNIELPIYTLWATMHIAATAGMSVEVMNSAVLGSLDFLDYSSLVHLGLFSLSKANKLWKGNLSDDISFSNKEPVEKYLSYYRPEYQEALYGFLIASFKACEAKGICASQGEVRSAIDSFYYTSAHASAYALVESYKKSGHNLTSHKNPCRNDVSSDFGIASNIGKYIPPTTAFLGLSVVLAKLGVYATKFDKLSQFQGSANTAHRRLSIVRGYALSALIFSLGIDSLSSLYTAPVDATRWLFSAREVSDKVLDSERELSDKEPQSEL